MHQSRSRARFGEFEIAATAMIPVGDHRWLSESHFGESSSAKLVEIVSAIEASADEASQLVGNSLATRQAKPLRLHGLTRPFSHLV